MPTISDFSYGFSSSGVDAYLEDIKSNALQNAKDAVTNLTDINSVLDTEWEGKAKDNFKTNLNKDAKHVADQFDALFTILTTEVHSVEAAMANKDNELISVD